MRYIPPVSLKLRHIYIIILYDSYKNKLFICSTGHICTRFLVCVTNGNITIIYRSAVAVTTRFSKKTVLYRLNKHRVRMYTVSFETSAGITVESSMLLLCVVVGIEHVTRECEGHSNDTVDMFRVQRQLLTLKRQQVVATTTVVFVIVQIANEIHPR